MAVKVDGILMTERQRKLYNKRKTKGAKVKSNIGRKCCYVGKIEGKGIVSYDGIVTKEFPQGYECRMYDRNIHRSDEKFLIKIKRKNLHFGK